MKECALNNSHGCISCAGPGEKNSFAICVAQAPLVPGTKTAMIVVTRSELKSWIGRLNDMLEHSVQ
jgi:hypothetical protein